MPQIQTAAAERATRRAAKDAPVTSLPGVPTLVKLLRLLEASPDTAGDALQLRRSLSDMSASSNRQYMAVMASICQRLGFCDAPGLRSIEWKHCQHESPYYDQWGYIQCRICIPPIKRLEPGKFYRELDLDVCPECLGDGEVLVKLETICDYWRCEMKPCSECDPWNERPNAEKE